MNTAPSNLIAHAKDGFARNSKCVLVLSAFWPLQTHKPQDARANLVSS